MGNLASPAEDLPLHSLDNTPYEYRIDEDQVSASTDAFRDRNDLAHYKNNDDVSSYISSDRNPIKRTTGELVTLVKEIKPEDTSQAPLQGRVLAHPATDAVRITSWVVMIISPLLFIGEPWSVHPIFLSRLTLPQL